MRPFELSFSQLESQIDEMVDITFSDIQSQFLVLPKGDGFVEYRDFQDAYEHLKRNTDGFRKFDEKTVWEALKADSLSFVVLRTILGLSPPEWADLAREECDSDVPQGAARKFDTDVRRKRDYLKKLSEKSNSISLTRISALIKVAVHYIGTGAPSGAANTVHRMNKFDTSDGLASLQHSANAHIPYAVLLYERYLGRPFASHRDSVSELVGDVMESAIEERLSRARITFRKTKRAERIPGFEQAPDFFVPTELSPSVIIEAKITGDDGTARDKVTRIKYLAKMRDDRISKGEPSFQVIACVDGRGFGVRRQDMKDMLLATKGKVFTLASLDHLVANSDLKKFLPKA